jgi:hypothetical protein
MSVYDSIPPMKISKNGTARNTLLNALAAVAESGVRPRFNTVKRWVVFECPQWDPYFGNRLNDITLMLLRERLIVRFRHLSYSPSKSNVFDAVKMLSYKDRIEPVRDSQ